MLIFKKVADLQKYLLVLKNRGLDIGFAPTMGALHAGHVSLIKQANDLCDVSVASIFVNPTQFNDPTDLAKYPRTPERDLEVLSEAGCQIVFMPSPEEVYPDGTTPSVRFNFGKLDRILEGVFRPGHFDGMAQVVHRLLDIVKPDKLFMGQKDFQQFAIVSKMLDLMQSKTQIVMCPIIREASGLAMSSRNVRLSTDEAAVAPLVYKQLSWAAELAETHAPDRVKDLVISELRKQPLFKLEYFDIVDGRTLLPVQTWADTEFVVALVAVFVGDVRLIDNLILKMPIADEVADTEH